jgi:hypothetical protein
VPCASDGAAGVFGRDGPPAAVASVLVADQALVPDASVLCTCTSYAAPALRPLRVYGLVTPATFVHMAAPELLNWRLKPAAALCVLSIAGVVQVTVRLLPVPCANDGAPGAFASWNVGVCGDVGVVELGRLKGCIVALGRFGTTGAGGYIGICVADPNRCSAHVVIWRPLSRR